MHDRVMGLLSLHLFFSIVIGKLYYFYFFISNKHFISLSINNQLSNVDPPLYFTNPHKHIRLKFNYLFLKRENSKHIPINLCY